MAAERRKIVVVLKGYPRLSETFIAQELLGLERADLDLTLVALRRPTDAKRHPVHDEIRAPVMYLPEYLHEEPWRVLKGLAAGAAQGGFWRALPAFLRDLARDLSRNRVRRFGQALVLAREWPEGGGWLHSHFIHTPASVTRYAAMLRGVGWTCSAHAKDIWTSDDWELSEKLRHAGWTVTCTRDGFTRLRGLAAGAPVHLSYHGLDLARFAAPRGAGSARDGSDATNPVRILSVGRAVEKKGYDVLLRALALLPPEVHWRFEHVGGGDRFEFLTRLAEQLGISGRVIWHGALAQEEVLELYRRSDIFALACRVAADGDRDGLPNVLVEASSQRLPCVSTTVAGVPELIVDGENGLLVAPDDPAALTAALLHLIRNPELRLRLGLAAERRVRHDFDYHSSVRQLVSLFERSWQAAGK